MSATTSSSTSAGEMSFSIAVSERHFPGRPSYRHRRQRGGKRGRPRGRGPRGYAARPKGAQTAYECSAEDITEESVLLRMAEEYVASIQPDPSTLVVPSHSEPCQELPSGSRGGVHHRSARDRASKNKRQPYGHVDHFVVTHSQRDRFGLPAGTKVMRPGVKLVQLVAQAIYCSPNGLLRVNHIYDALQKKYPYFLFLQKKALSSWKSSIRHALFQRWFIKLRISNGTTCRRTRCYYWGLNYNSRPREWTMPGLSCHEEPEQVEAVDVNPFGEDLADALLDDSTALDWLLPLEDAKPIAGLDERPLEPHPSTSADIQNFSPDFQEMSTFTDMDVGTVSLLDTEGLSASDDPASTSLLTATCPPTFPCSMDGGSAEWLPDWTADWTADWPADWWTVPLGLPSPGESSATNERQSHGINVDFMTMDG